MQQILVQFLGLEDSLEKSMATHSSILAWRIPWTEEPGGLQPMGSERVSHHRTSKPAQHGARHVSGARKTSDKLTGHEPCQGESWWCQDAEVKGRHQEGGGCCPWGASARCRGEQHDFCSSRWGTWMRKQGDKLKDHVFYHHHQINILLEVAPQVALVLKNPPANAGSIRDVGLIPGLGRAPGGGNGNSLQYSFLENPMDRGAWQPTVHGAANRWAQLKQLSTCGTV